VRWQGEANQACSVSPDHLAARRYRRRIASITPQVIAVRRRDDFEACRNNIEAVFKGADLRKLGIAGFAATWAP
jgi:hypothetical protein